ncbi:unnamed protein product [Cunninghamella blakesleeana]
MKQEDASSDNEIFLKADTNLTQSEICDKSIQKCKSKHQRAREVLIKKQINELNDIQKTFSQCVDKDLISTKRNQRYKRYKVIKGREFLEQNYDNIKTILKQFDDMSIKNTTEKNNKDLNEEEKLNYQSSLTGTLNFVIRRRRIEHEKQLYKLTKQQLEEQIPIKIVQRHISKAPQEEFV